MFWAPGSNPTNDDFPITVPSVLANVVAVSGGYSHSLALNADGTVMAWGIDTDGQMDVPAGLRNVVAIAAGADSSLVLKADGTVAGRGFSRDLTNGLSGLTKVVAVSAGWNEWLALKADGTVVGQSWYGVPSGLTNIVSICASSGNDHHISLAIKADGTVAGWGFNFFGGPMVPPGLSNVVAVASDSSHSLALVGGGSPFLRNRLISRTAVMSGNTYFRIEASGAWPLSYQWQFTGADLPGATGPVLVLTNLQPGQAGTYSVKVSNALGTVARQWGVPQNTPQFGALYAGATLTSAANLPFFGRLIDRVTLRTFSLAVGFGLVTACFAMALASNVAVLFLAILDQRLTGQGLLSLTVSPAMARVFTEARQGVERVRPQRCLGRWESAQVLLQAS